MCKLVPALSESHRSFPFDFIGLLIQHQAVISNDSANLIFLQFSTNQKYLVLSLYACEPFRHDFMVPDRDGRRVLILKRMHKHYLELLIEVMQTRLL